MITRNPYTAKIVPTATGGVPVGPAMGAPQGNPYVKSTAEDGGSDFSRGNTTGGDDTGDAGGDWSRGNSSGGDGPPTTYELPPVNVVGHREADPTANDGPTDNSDPYGFLDGSHGSLPPGFLDQFTNAGSDFMKNFDPRSIAALAAAYQQHQNASKYTKQAEDYASKLNPFGEERTQYQKMLSDSWNDPTKVLSDPAHTKQLQLDLDNVARQGAAKGFMGSGGMLKDLSDYTSASNAKYLNDERASLAHLAGADIGPAAAGHILETGMLGNITSENNAMDNIMKLLVPKDKSGSNITINNAGGPNGGGPGGGKIPNPADILKPGAIDAGKGPASQWIAQQLARGIKVDPNDPHVRDAIVEQTPQGIYKDPGMETGSPGDNEDIMRNYGGDVNDSGNPYSNTGDPYGGYGDNPYANFDVPYNYDYNFNDFIDP